MHVLPPHPTGGGGIVHRRIGVNTCILTWQSENVSKFLIASRSTGILRSASSLLAHRPRRYISIFFRSLFFPSLVICCESHKLRHVEWRNAKSGAREVYPTAIHRVTSHREGNVSRRCLREDPRCGRNGKQLTIEHALRYLVLCVWVFLLK